MLLIQCNQYISAQMSRRTGCVCKYKYEPKLYLWCLQAHCMTLKSKMASNPFKQHCNPSASMSSVVPHWIWHSFIDETINIVGLWSLVPVSAGYHEAHVVYLSGAYSALRQAGVWIQMTPGLRTSISLNTGWRCFTLEWQIAWIPLSLVSSWTGTLIRPHFLKIN